MGLRKNKEKTDKKEELKAKELNPKIEGSAEELAEPREFETRITVPELMILDELRNLRSDFHFHSEKVCSLLSELNKTLKEVAENE